MARQKRAIVQPETRLVLQKFLRRHAGIIFIYLSIIPPLKFFFYRPQADLSLYYRIAFEIFHDQLPYLDRIYEYPPYSLVLFVLPCLGGGIHNFQILFSLQVLIADLAIKVFLLKEATLHASGVRALLPCIMFSTGSVFLCRFYLQRYDLFPAVVTFASVWALSRANGGVKMG